MFGSSMLDIAIGVIFVFMLLSVFATAINEIILSSMNMRGKELLRGIATLLSDKNASGLVEKVYTHGQVFGLYDGLFSPNKRKNLPAYIPSRNFALALLDSIGERPFSEFKSQAAPVHLVQGDSAQTDGDRPTAAVQVTAAVQEVATITQSFKDAAQKLAENSATDKVGKPLVSMIAMAGNDAAKLQKSVEDWYNSGMDRVSGWYKYRTQWVLFWIGLTMAIALNADSINIVRQISRDSTLRQSIVAAAQSSSATRASDGQTGDGRPPSDGQAAGKGDQTTDQRMIAAKNAFKDIDNLGLPLGWPQGDPAATTPGEKISRCLAWITGRPSMLLGWLLTAIAISLGAPFWFDALNKIMVIRSTVKPREKSHDEGSKDKSKD